MIALALSLAAFAGPTPLPGSGAVFECRSTERALIPLPDRAFTLAVRDGAFAVQPADFAPLASPRVVTRSGSRLELVADVEGFDAEFEAQLVRAEAFWRIEWRVVEAVGSRGERRVQVAGEGTCTMAEQ